MKTNHERNVEPLHMLPRFDSQEYLRKVELDRLPKSSSISHYNSFAFENLVVYDDEAHENTSDANYLVCQSVSDPQLTTLFLPRFHSDHRRYYYDENQSADVPVKTTSQTNLNTREVHETNYRPNTSDIKFLERAYDRSGKKCWPATNTNIGKFDLEYAYEIIGDTLESYIRYRKLDRCKALSNFIEYRNKVYKREKIAQYALPETKANVQNMQTKRTVNTPTKMTKIKEKQSPSVSPSTISETLPATFISPSPSPSPSVNSQASQNVSPQTSKEAIIPIPSPELLKRSTPKSIQLLHSPKQQTSLNVPKKAVSNIKQMKVKQTSLPSVKEPSQSKPNVTFKTKTFPKKTLTKNHNQTPNNNQRKHKTCTIL